MVSIRDGGHLTEDGHLSISYRGSHSDNCCGDAFPPTYRGTFTFSRYIQECMGIGGPGNDYVVCLGSMDFQNVGNWAERTGVGHTTFLICPKRLRLLS